MNMKKAVYRTTIILSVALCVCGVSYAQDFLGPIQLKIDAERQNAGSEQAAYLEQKSQMEALATSSTDENASSTDLKALIEKKLGKTLDADRMQVATDFENAIARLNDLIGRIDSRTAKMQAAGIDISSSTAPFDAAKAGIAAATDNVTVLEDLLAKPTSASTRKNILTQIKKQSDVTKQSIQTAYQSILDLIKELMQESENAISADAAGQNQDQSTTSSGE